MSIRDDLERLVVKNVKFELTSVADDDVLGVELGLDSQALLGLLLDAEDRFGIEIPSERVPDLVGIRFEELVQLVEDTLRVEAARKETRT